MSAENKVRLVDVWVGVRDPRQVTKVEHDLVELLVVSVSAVLSGADTFAEIEAWAKEKLDWLRQYLKLEQGIPSQDVYKRQVPVSRCVSLMLAQPDSPLAARAIVTSEMTIFFMLITSVAC